MSEPEPVRDVLRVIGDVHGYVDTYIRIASRAKYSIQLGDMDSTGIQYPKLNALDPTHHFVIAGNHDNYEVDDGRKFVKQTPHFLNECRFMALPVFGGSLLTIRGERSIDKVMRTPGYDWWPDEEIHDFRWPGIVKFFADVRPEFVLTHGCPASVIPHVARYTHFYGEELKPSATAHWLQECLDAHQPKEWVFGHYHMDKAFVVGNTLFRCIGELSHVDYPLNKEIETK